MFSAGDGLDLQVAFLERPICMHDHNLRTYLIPTECGERKETVDIARPRFCDVSWPGPGCPGVTLVGVQQACRHVHDAHSTREVTPPFP